MEFCSFQNDRLRRIRWMDPTTLGGEPCCWSLSVSLPDPTGEFCELRASSTRPITDQSDYAALTSLLKTFGAHFAAHTDQVFGPPAVVAEPAVAGAQPDHQRRAA